MRSTCLITLPSYALISRHPFPAAGAFQHPERRHSSYRKCADCEFLPAQALAVIITARMQNLYARAIGLRGVVKRLRSNAFRWRCCLQIRL
jgi:hypothetical protein